MVQQVDSKVEKAQQVKEPQVVVQLVPIQVAIQVQAAVEVVLVM
jgi:hypothetical protein